MGRKFRKIMSIYNIAYGGLNHTSVKFTNVNIQNGVLLPAAKCT